MRRQMNPYVKYGLTSVDRMLGVSSFVDCIFRSSLSKKKNIQAHINKLMKVYFSYRNLGYFFYRRTEQVSSIAQKACIRRGIP